MISDATNWRLICERTGEFVSFMYFAALATSEDSRIVSALYKTMSQQTMLHSDRMSQTQQQEHVSAEAEAFLKAHSPVVVTIAPEPLRYDANPYTLHNPTAMTADRLGNLFVIDNGQLVEVETLRRTPVKRKVCDREFQAVTDLVFIDEHKQPGRSKVVERVLLVCHAGGVTMVTGLSKKGICFDLVSTTNGYE